MTGLLETFLLIMVLMLVMWSLSLVLRDCGIVDIFWAPGFAITLWATCFLVPHVASPALTALLILVTLWALRLGGHLFVRWQGHEGEDRRYAAMRRKHGPNWWWWSFFQVFLLQGTLMWAISLPLQLTVSAGPAPLNWLLYVGVAVAGAGIAIEALADWQLTAFRREPVNVDQVMDRGIWGWSRHPNYFGDFTMWWGFYLIALSADLGHWWTIFSPIMMSILLLRISGVTMLEHTIGRRRPGYEEYIRRTSVFVPLPPRG
ncbi:MAG TPA: DUF1295 domain-containing protein [Rhizomicrobium sp.]|jgi:steroid 5-alpha reductase family enzyme|nr:DUF1295 domain-containing protein [Rhizomicrobium sp.]